MPTLYCDESGFTGPDLLNNDQPFFSYGSVLIDPVEASELVSKARQDFRLQSNELKGSRMLDSSPGRKAARYLFEQLATRSITTVMDKRFSLAGKLYEYIFDPVVEGNSALYNVGFHKCVTNLLYEQFTNQNPHTIDLLTKFQQSVRARDFTSLVIALNDGKSSTEASQLAQQLGKFCSEQHDLIEEEFEDSGNEVVDKWGLDLSSTAATTILRLWAERDTEIHAVLDDSKPLTAWAQAIEKIFPIQPGPQVKGEYYTVEGRRHRLNFSLAEPIRFASSTITPGLQLADVMAAFVSNLLANRTDPSVHHLLKEAIKHGAIDSGSVFPEHKYVDPAEPQASLNLALLPEIFAASTRGEVIADAIQGLAQKVIKQAAKGSISPRSSTSRRQMISYI
jgi:Protein of unknown function (DUF3800)